MVAATKFYDFTPKLLALNLEPLTLNLGTLGTESCVDPKPLTLNPGPTLRHQSTPWSFDSRLDHKACSRCWNTHRSPRYQLEDKVNETFVVKYVIEPHNVAHVSAFCVRTQLFDHLMPRRARRHVYLLERKVFLLLPMVCPAHRTPDSPPNLNPEVEIRQLEPIFACNGVDIKILRNQRKVADSPVLHLPLLRWLATHAGPQDHDHAEPGMHGARHARLHLQREFTPSSRPIPPSLSMPGDDEKILLPSKAEQRI